MDNHHHIPSEWRRGTNDLAHAVSEVLLSSSATPSAVPRAVTRVRNASRVLEDLNTIEHNEARRVRRTKKPVALSTSTSYEVLRETTEVADLLPLPIHVAAGSAQVRRWPPASNLYYRHALFCGCIPGPF